MGIDAAYEVTGDTGSEDSQLWQRLLKKLRPDLQKLATWVWLVIVQYYLQEPAPGTRSAVGGRGGMEVRIVGVVIEGHWDWIERVGEIEKRCG